MATDCVDRRVLETERYAAPVDPGTDGSRRLALPRPAGARARDPHRRPRVRRRRCATARSASSRSGAPRSRPGYYRRPDANAELFHDGWLRTGDLAYTLDGELVMCGRIKDVIIVGGRNVFPEDVERAVGDVDGVRAGNVIAFGVDGERGARRSSWWPRPRPTTARPCAARSTTGSRRWSACPPKDIVLVTPGTLPKTSSGKLQRSLCRRRYEDGQLVLVDA